MLLLVTFNLIAWAWLPQLPLDGVGGRAKGKRGGGGGAVPQRYQRAYLWGLVAVELATSWVLPPLLGQRLPFLPLMCVSLYSSLGMLHGWRRLAAQCW